MSDSIRSAVDAALRDRRHPNEVSGALSSVQKLFKHEHDNYDMKILTCGGIHRSKAAFDAIAAAL